LKAGKADMRSRIIIYSFFALLFVIAVFFSIRTGQLYFLSFPFFLLFFVWVCINPEWLLYILLASIPWSIEYNFTPSLGTDLPDEPLMLLTSFAIIGYLIYFHKRKDIRISASSLWFLLLFQLAWMLIAVCVSTDFIISAKFFLAKTWYLGAFVIAPYFIFQNRKKFLNAMVILAGSMTVFVLLTMVRHGAAGFHFSTINPSLAPFFRNHVNYSALLVCMLPLLYFFYRSVNGGGKKVLGVLIFISIVALYFTYARGAWLALVVGIAANWLLRKRFLLKSVIIALVMLFAVTTWLIHDNKYLDYAHDYKTTIFHNNFEEHLIATYEFKDVSTAERFYRWIAGVRMVKYKWAAGYGPNTFYSNYKAYAVPAFKTWVSKNEEGSTVHNYFLLTLIEQGVPGLILLLLLVGYMFYTAQKLYNSTNDVFIKRTVAAAAIVLSMLCTVNFLSDLVETDKLGSIFYLCLAVLLVMEKEVRRRGTQYEAINEGK
jgi:O-antigen ligase